MNRQIVVLVSSLCLAGCVSGVADEGSDAEQRVAILPVIGGATVPVTQQSTQAFSTESTGNGIGYNGGPIMSGTVSVYYIWYGNWNGDSAGTILSDWANNIGSSANYLVNETYDDNGGHHVSAAVRLGGVTSDSYSRGSSIKGGDVWTIVKSALSSNRLPADPNGVYFVLTSKDVDNSDGFCTQFCGWHTYGSYNGVNIKYGFIGDARRCNGSCGGLGTTPNGNAGADNMASILFHELSETVSDPLLNAWGDNNGENGDKCAWKFGSEYTTGNGAKANAHVGNRDFLLQQMWANTGGGYCTTALPLPMGASAPSGCGQMTPNKALAAGQSVASCDGRFRLAMQYDGNFVLYQGGSALWATGTWGSTGYAAIQQNDGNLVVYDVNQHALWASGTWNHPGARLAMQNDGNAVVYDASGPAIWASGTCCR